MVGLIVGVLKYGILYSIEEKGGNYMDNLVCEVCETLDIRGERVVWF